MKFLIGHKAFVSLLYTVSLCPTLPYFATVFRNGVIVYGINALKRDNNLELIEREVEVLSSKL